jgi:hypothetical protein
MGSCSAFLACAAISYAGAEIYLRSTDAAASSSAELTSAPPRLVRAPELATETSDATPSREDEFSAEEVHEDAVELALAGAPLTELSSASSLQLLATLDASGSADPGASTATILNRARNTIDAFREGEAPRPGLEIVAIGRQRVLLREDGALGLLTIEASSPLTLLEGPTPGARARYRGAPLEINMVDVPDGGVGVGRTNRGRLVHGVQLPANPELYTRRMPGNSWGTTHAIDALQRAVAGLRRDTGYRGEIMIGDISRRHGGHFAPHKSHQSGRDVDIRVPGSAERRDWDAAWGLVQALIKTRQVERIFLDYGRQRDLYEAARRVGVPTGELARVLQYPEGRGTPAIVQHQSGHKEHVHVRFKCGPSERRCE